MDGERELTRRQWDPGKYQPGFSAGNLQRNGQETNRETATMEIIRRNTPAVEPETKYYSSAMEPVEDNQQKQARRNPRLVIGSLDFFDLLMEQDEQQ